MMLCNEFCCLLLCSAVPEAPGTPDATHVTGNSITLGWTRPRSDGGNEIKHYILERREKKSLRWVKVSAKRPITELRHRVTNLTEGNEYEFRVMAENGAGVGLASSTSRLFKCKEPTSAPSAPTMIKVDLSFRYIYFVFRSSSDSHPYFLIYHLLKTWSVVKQRQLLIEFVFIQLEGKFCSKLFIDTVLSFYLCLSGH